MIFCLGLFQWTMSQSMVNYLIIEAQAGDGVLSVLKRYGVSSTCNTGHFYEINSIGAKTGLVRGNSYKLPIIVYRYNGTSIRSTVGISDLPQAQRIQAFNEALHKNGTKPADYRNDRILWVPYHEFACPEERTEIVSQVETASPNPIPTVNPSGKMRGDYDIFGEKYKGVPYRSDILKDALYFIVSGHGGPDPGATARKGRSTLCEDEYAYDIALRMAHFLISHGALCYIIVRDDNDGIRDESILKPDYDEYYWGDATISSSQLQRLATRANIINKLSQDNKWRNYKYQRTIILHIDSDRKGKREDVFIYHTLENAESKQMAETMVSTLENKYKQYQKNRPFTGFVKGRDLFMLRETKPTTVFVELGNIRNYGDQQRFLKSSNRQLLATWLAEGVIQEKRRKSVK